MCDKKVRKCPKSVDYEFSWSELLSRMSKELDWSTPLKAAPRLIYKSHSLQDVVLLLSRALKVGHGVAQRKNL